jgi:hypothetical protein
MYGNTGRVPIEVFWNNKRPTTLPSFCLGSQAQEDLLPHYRQATFGKSELTDSTFTDQTFKEQPLQ